MDACTKMADLLKITFYKLIKFMQADIGTALMSFLYKLAKRQTV
jgi:hypothetical protein